MRLSIFVNLVGHCDGFLAIVTLVALSPSRVVSKGGAAIADPCRTRIFHCYYIPTKVQMGLACYCLPLACFCLPRASYCLPLACYCLSLTAYPLLLLPLTRLLTISAYPLACYCLPCNALLAGAALVIAHTCVADRIAYPYGVWDCLCYSRPVSHTGLPTHARPSC